MRRLPIIYPLNRLVVLPVDAHSDSQRGQKNQSMMRKKCRTLVLAVGNVYFAVRDVVTTERSVARERPGVQQQKRCLFIVEPNPDSMTAPKRSCPRPLSLHSSTDPRPVAGLSPSRGGAPPLERA